MIKNLTFVEILLWLWFLPFLIFFVFSISKWLFIELPNNFTSKKSIKSKWKYLKLIFFKKNRLKIDYLRIDTWTNLFFFCHQKKKVKKNVLKVSLNVFLIRNKYFLSNIILFLIFLIKKMLMMITNNRFLWKNFD